MSLLGLPEARKKIWLDAITFLSALLLFQIELIIAKILLPKYGGSYLVWGACMVFFQGALLLGYLYAHVVITKLGIIRYRYFHILLVLLPLVFFPGRPLVVSPATHNLPVVINIFWLLLLSIGPVFFVLSTTSIVLQSWLADSELPQRHNPYTLYAISNLGSFLALFSYPFLFEYFFNLQTQLVMWRVLYVFLAALHVVALFSIRLKEQASADSHPSVSLEFPDMLYWFLLSAGSTIMFLSVTNIITLEITPGPLLWILPLSIYLISFTLNFKERPWCPAWITERFHIIVGWSLAFFFLMYKRIFPFMIESLIYFALLFVLCMFCNRQLVSTKPKNPRHLPTFYVTIALGGFLGGMFITWIVPLISTILLEFLIGLLVISAAVWVKARAVRFGGRGLRFILYFIIILVSWPKLFLAYNVFGLVILFVLLTYLYKYFRTDSLAFVASILVVVLCAPLIVPFWEQDKSIYRFRNYYGIYKIFDVDDKRFLVNASTTHGAQYLVPELEMKPLTYFHPFTPVGSLLTSDLFKFSHIGVVGLGTGTLAAYAKTGQVMDFFELDPDVFTLAQKYFTYAQKSTGKINFIFGDARLKLQEAQPASYDLLVIDAFNGDAIPEHLLTTEAIMLYKRCLKAEGIILFHISNRFVSLQPVLLKAAEVLQARACYKMNPIRSDAFASIWVAFGWDEPAFKKLSLRLSWNALDLGKNWAKLRPWTDQYSTLMPIVKVQELLAQIKTFSPFFWTFFTERDREINKGLRYLQMGRAYANNKEFAEAIHYYKKVLVINDKSAPALYLLGRALARLGKNTEAVSYYQQAISLDTSSADPFLYLGRAYAAQGEYPQAIDQYRKAIEMEPQGALAYLDLARVYTHLGEYQKAIEQVRQVVELNPENKRALLQLGITYTSMGEKEKTLENLQKAVQLFEQED